MVNLEDVAGKIISFGDAMEFAKQGISVSNVNWGFRERLSGHPNAMRVEASKIWSAENRKAALRNPDSAITVRPYMTKTDGEHIDNWLPSAKDMYDQWMLSATYSRLASISQQNGQSDKILNLDFSCIKATNPHHPFWMLYDQDMLGYGANTICIGGSDEVNARNLNLISCLEKHISDRSAIGDDPADDVDTIDVGPCNQIVSLKVDDEYKLLSVVVDKAFDEQPLHAIAATLTQTNVYLDVDSLNELELSNGENALEYLKGIIHQMSETNPNINWVSFSFDEQMQLSFNL